MLCAGCGASSQYCVICFLFCIVIVLYSLGGLKHPTVVVSNSDSVIIIGIGDCVLYVVSFSPCGMSLQPTTAMNFTSPVRVDGCCVRDAVSCPSVW